MSRAAATAVLAIACALGCSRRDEPAAHQPEAGAAAVRPPTPRLSLSLQQRTEPIEAAVESPPIGPSEPASQALAIGDAARDAGDLARAIVELARGCDAGHPRACEHAAALETDPVRAAQLRQRESALDIELCDRAWAPACHQLALVSLAAAGDPAAGLALFRKAGDLYATGCQEGDGSMCWGLFQLVDSATAHRDAAADAGAEILATHPASDLLAAGCKAKLAGACARAAQMFTRGEYGHKADPVAAFGWWRDACTVGDNAACSEIARRYEKADGIARDLSRAEHWRKVACLRGQATSCADSCRLSRKRGAPDPDTCKPPIDR